MPSNSDSDDRAARHERADAIRRLRDKRNASLNVPGDATPATPADPNEAEDDTAPADSPNYVDFIDRKMRQPKKE